MLLTGNFSEQGNVSGHTTQLVGPEADRIRQGSAATAFEAAANELTSANQGIELPPIADVSNVTQAQLPDIHSESEEEDESASYSGALAALSVCKGPVGFIEFPSCFWESWKS